MGTCTYLIEDTTYDVKDGAIFLIPPGFYHVLQVPPQSNYERCILNFSSHLFPYSISINEPLCCPVTEELAALFLRFDAYADRYSGEVLNELFCSCITELIINLSYAQTDTVTLSFPALVKNAIEYISSHIHENLTIENIAEALFVSPSHLSHLFSDTMHTSIMRYVRMKKMYIAQQYLLKGTSPTATAALLGYDSYPTFLRNYRAQFNSLPSRHDKKTNI